MQPDCSSFSTSARTSSSCAGPCRYGGSAIGFVSGYSLTSWTSSTPRAGGTCFGNWAGLTSAYSRNNSANVCRVLSSVTLSRCLAAPSGKPSYSQHSYNKYSFGEPTHNNSFIVLSTHSFAWCRSSVPTTTLTRQHSAAFTRACTYVINSLGTIHTL